MTDEQAIRELITRWADAVHTGELDSVLVDHDSDIVMFDVPPPYDGLRGIDAYRECWPPFFELDLTAGADVAFAYALLRYCAAVSPRSSRPTPTTGCGSRSV